MVLVMVRRKTGPLERQPTMLKEEVENNSRNSRDLVIKLA
jgi:hypothetical protein